MTGIPSLALSRALWKINLMCLSVSPTYLLSSSGPLIFKKYDLPVSLPVFSETFFANELATAFAIKVLPHPGGP